MEGHRRGHRRVFGGALVTLLVAWITTALPRDFGFLRSRWTCECSSCSFPDPELFGKTFDQQLDLAGHTIGDRDIAPNRRIPGEIVFEPLLNGVRVTARDNNHRVLWGFIGSIGMLKLDHCPIAVYETLQGLLSEDLKKHELPAPKKADPMAAAEQAISALRETADKLREAITVKKVSQATIERATAIARVANDANRMILLETSSFAG